MLKKLKKYNLKQTVSLSNVLQIYHCADSLFFNQCHIHREYICTYTVHACSHEDTEYVCVLGFLPPDSTLCFIQ